MRYKCVDSGSEKCPCTLMEWGTCYTCKMAAGGICDCGGNGQWQGVCPFSEYLLNGKKTQLYSDEREFTISSYSKYSDELYVLHIDVTPGFAERCSRPGAFVMIKSLGFDVPLSVIKVNVAGESFVEIGLQVIGPKTKALLARIERTIGGEGIKSVNLEMKGPFYSGVVNPQLLDVKRNKAASTSIAARGMAIAPLINCLKWMFGSLDGAAEKIEDGSFLIDYGTVPDKFISDYLGQKLIAKSLRVHFTDGMEDVWELGEKSEIFIFLASPFYTDMLENRHPEFVNKTVFANHGNMCCGRGICGSCSYVDRDGTVVKKCKCNSTVPMVK